MAGARGRSTGEATPPAASAQGTILPASVAKFGVASKFFSHIYSKLEVPAVEIIVHLAIAILAILGIASIERLVHLVGLEDRDIPLIHVKLSDLLFLLDVVASTFIISIGMIKAVMATWRAP